jgi:hypothetical protein
MRVLLVGSDQPEKARIRPARPSSDVGFSFAILIG